MKTYRLYDQTTQHRLTKHPHPTMGQPVIWTLPDDQTPDNPNLPLSPRQVKLGEVRVTDFAWIEDVPAPSLSGPTRIHDSEIDWVAGQVTWTERDRTPEELAAMVPPPPTAEQQLQTARAGMSGLMGTLPVESRAKFAMARSAIETLLDIGDTEAAHYLLSGIQTDTPAEADVKATLVPALEKFLPKKP